MTRVVGIALLAVVVHDARALEARGVSGVGAVVVDRERDACVDATGFGEFLGRSDIQASKSSRPWAGAVCTKPVPASSVTWSPAKQRHGDSRSRRQVPVSGWAAVRPAISSAEMPRRRLKVTFRLRCGFLRKRIGKDQLSPGRGAEIILGRA